MRVLVLAAGLAAALCGGEVLADPRVLADVELERAFEGMPFVRLTVNGSEPLAFLIDTSGAGSILDRDVAKRLGMLPVPGRASVSGVAALDVGVVPKAKIRLGDATLDTRLMTISLASLAPTFGRRVDGILGGDFLTKYAVEERTSLPAAEPRILQSSPLRRHRPATAGIASEVRSGDSRRRHRRFAGRHGRLRDRRHRSGDRRRGHLEADPRGSARPPAAAGKTAPGHGAPEREEDRSHADDEGVVVTTVAGCQLPVTWGVSLERSLEALRPGAKPRTTDNRQPATTLLPAGGEQGLGRLPTPCNCLPVIASDSTRSCGPLAWEGWVRSIGRATRNSVARSR